LNQVLISVCICTYRRPEFLTRLLDALGRQSVDERFSFEIVVTDNDRKRTAEEVVRRFRGRSDRDVVYDCEPEQNISRARNRTVSNARGEFIAFIDDDEFPGPEWLRTLFAACRKFQADGVLGPVNPVYEGTPPRWLIESGLCNRDSFPTGTLLDDSRFMRTGNVLFSRRILEKSGEPFDPAKGLTGGEDADFFDRMLLNGRTFVWCDEAGVFETVPEERQRMGYHVKRAFLQGMTTADQEPLIGTGTLKSLAAVAVYAAGLPVLMAVSRPLFVRYFVKGCNHAAKLLGHCGIRPVEKRTF
jgi:glycosyltransferase involved in cell wall biosynthesis